ncbi:MAG: tRNA guanosine(15) transglycosylase TgtA [Promethearchaeota archaeon]|nr:MAG: tRNA guanosine(15) transglycosylase TgtA [Candidatus Lokiarchaeota archaeon]
MNFEILDIDGLGRIGKIEVNNKQIITPNLFPVVHPYRNIIPPIHLKKFGVQALFTNAYILYQNENLREVVKKNSIHHYLNFEGLIATDSGAFQQYMYNNNQFNINAEEIEKFQEDINSDFPVILDIPVQLKDTYLIAKKKVLNTIERAKDNIARRTNENCNWFGPIHGGKYLDLLEFSSREMSKLKFDVFAIGGLVKAFLEYRFDLTLQILLNVKKNLIPNKPIHMFGLGLPQFFSLAIACGCDLMDSAAYILYAKENRYFTLSTGTKSLEELEEFPCHCPICCEYSPKELKKLEKSDCIELLAKHNLYLSFSELKTVRQAIREGNLWELVEQRIKSHPFLVEAAKIIKNYIDFFEAHEKIYKNHGRLLVSSQSISRPLIHRYIARITENYRIPENVKYLIVLPELDVKGDSSLTVQNWLEEIYKENLDFKEFIHVVFMSAFFGIIPMELIHTFPLGQNESIKVVDVYDLLYKNSIAKAKIFFDQFSMSYEQCGVLIPKNFINQFEELIEFSKNHPIQGLDNILTTKFKSNYIKSDKISEILQFFKEKRER